jgi:long-chain-fatty-acid--CoA ligase ACSBG
VSRAAHVRKFIVVPMDFSLPGGEFTPTLKLKRKVVEGKYKVEIEDMYANEPKL